MKPFGPLAILAAGAIASAAVAANSVPAGSATCEIIDRSPAVALLACPGGLSNEALRQAGTAACKSARICNAWIWVDRSKAPQKAPVQDTDIPESARAQAVAIWVNQSEGLITLRRVAK